MSVNIEQSWKTALSAEWEKPYFAKLKDFLQAEKAAGHTIYPAGKHIFRAFDTTPFDKVKVVLIGQDPYHGEGQAEGLSFSVPQGISIPPSLRNIYKELATDIEGFQIPKQGSLVKWAEQGVLLLNATLTVRANTAGSHQNKGWETFTDAVIAALNEQREGIVFMLWGAYAHKKGAIIDTNKHLVLKAAHPSPMAGQGKPVHPFMGNKHFSQANAYLQQQGNEAINWIL